MVCFKLPKVVCFKIPLTERNHCERIKTIGDAYLAVCGMPESNPLHARNIVQAAKEIVQFVIDRNLNRKIQWAVRIGIHTGKVVGGVVGRRKYIYDIFGDTINTTSRIESHSHPMKINLSSVTYELIKDDFKLEDGHVVHVKGKGDLKIYQVLAD